VFIEVSGCGARNGAARYAGLVAYGPRSERVPRDAAHPLKGARIVVGVAGGVAAYKAVLSRLLALRRSFKDCRLSCERSSRRESEARHRRWAAADPVDPRRGR
jgi:hypothetical protein